MRTPWNGIVLGTAVAAGILGAFQALIHPRITDPDAFYHMGHAAVYRSEGLGASAFPWTAFSIIGEVGSDLWYGLHVLLIPFAGSASLAGGEAMAAGADSIAPAIRIAAFLLATLGAALVAWVAASHRWVASAIWPALFLLAVPNVLFRYLSVRPEALSIPLALVLLSSWVRGRVWIVAAAAFATTWVHLSMFWLTIGVAAAGTLGGIVSNRRRPFAEEARLGLALLAGMAGGALLRPNPLGGLELAWVQIAELLFEKTGGAPLTFATELSPISIGGALVMAWPALLAWIVAVAWGGTRLRRGNDADERRAADVALFLASSALALCFLVLTLVVARRSLVYWAAFAIPGLAFAASEFAKLPNRKPLVERALLVSAIPLFAWGLQRNDLNARFIAIAPDRLAAEAAWLAEASDPGDLVFNTHWDAFGPLFARNRTNHYLGGMDPIFQFAADPRRYWLFHHLSTGVATSVTCPAADCTPDDVVDVWDAIRGEYDARWVLAERARDGRLIEYLDTDGRFRRVFEGRDGVVFEVAVSVGQTPGPG